MIEPGKMRHLATIQRQMERPSSFDLHTKNPQYEDLGQIWVDLRPIGGKETINAGGIANETTHYISCRYTKLISPGVRLVVDNRKFYISSIMNVGEQKAELQLLVTEKTEV